MHRFYQEKYQINGGRQNRYVTGSDAVGLTMGTYDTTKLPIYDYLHADGAPNYVIADRFFQGANGGSFLNHQWLIAGRAPVVDTGRLHPGGQDGRSTRSSTPTGCRPTLPPVHSDRHRRRRPADRGVRRPGRGGELSARVRQLRRQHRPAGQAPRSTGRYMPLIDDDKYPNIGDRLSAEGDLLGVVLGWLG